MIFKSNNSLTKQALGRDTGFMVQALIPGTTGATPKIVNEVFGDKLRQVRRFRNLSQTELGELVRLSRVTIANIEGGKQNVQLHQVFAFAIALDAAVERLLPSAAELEQRWMGFDRVRSDHMALNDVLFLSNSKAMLLALQEGKDHANEK